MRSDRVSFDIDRAEVFGQRMRNESERLKRLANKLRRASEATESWWNGDSKTGFLRRAKELVSYMNKAGDLVNDMSEDIFTAAARKRDSEKLMNEEVRSTINLDQENY